VSVLRGKILDTEPLRRWFVVETLYTLARAYTTLEDGAGKAVHYLTVAKNLAQAAPRHQVDFPQTIEVSRTVVLPRVTVVAVVESGVLKFCVIKHLLTCHMLDMLL